MFKFAYRDEENNITECKNLGEAVAMLKQSNEGTICRLTEGGRWYGTNIDQIYEFVREKVAIHTIRQLIKQGYSESGTDQPIQGVDTIYNSWPFIRQMVLIRDGHVCKLCSGTTELEVHHILPRSEGGADNPVNLITLCGVCHKLIHRNRRFQDLRVHKTQTRLDVFIPEGVEQSV